VSERCRHNRSWVIASGYMLWCYECGAIRPMEPIDGETNTIAPTAGWIKPVGKGGKNPSDKLAKRCA